MIHLDRNHSSPIVSNPKSNLILQSSAHSDQHQLLSWSTPDHDDTSFYQGAQEQYLADPPDNSLSLTPDAPAALTTEKDSTSSTTVSSSAIGPITPGDAEDPKLPESSPSSPADVLTPAAPSTSSLTPPPPEISTPNHSVDVEERAQEEFTQPSTEEVVTTAPAGDVEEPDRTSRQSTPLSELSSAPDEEAETNKDIADGAGATKPSSEIASVSGSGQSAPSPSKQGDAASETASSMTGSQSTPAPKAMSPPGAVATGSSPRGLEITSPETMTAPSGEPSQTTLEGSQPVPALNPNSLADSSPSREASRPASTVPQGSYFPASSGSPTSAASTSTLDPKVVAILELNTHLLKYACIL